MTDVEKRDAARLEALASEINEEHRAFIGSLKKTAEHGIRAGELLSEAKAQCNHGEWLPWLENNFEGSARTAQEYMKLYKHRDEIRTKTQNSAHLSISGALREIEGPKAAPSTYDLAGRLQTAAAKGAGELAYQYGSLARDLSEEELSRVRGFAWERAWNDYKTSVEHPDEGARLVALRAIDRHVRPADLLPSRQRFAYEDELEEWEMNTPFEVLIEGGFICDYPESACVLRPLHRAHIDGDRELFEHLYELLKKTLNESLASVRPSPADEDYYYDEEEEE